MSTRIEVIGTAGTRPVWRLTSGALTARVVEVGAGSLRIGLLATTALLLSGDEVDLEIAVDGDIRVTVFEVAGTVAYDMRGGRASWATRVSLTQGADLELGAEPFVVATGAVVERSLDLSAEAGCRASLRESVVFGRSGEVGGDLLSRTRLSYDDRPLLRETLDLSAARRGAWTTLGPYRCLDTLTTVGHRLPDDPAVLQLEEPGSVARSCTEEWHRSAVGSAAASISRATAAQIAAAAGPSS